jgi:hypothetical protein
MKIARIVLLAAGIAILGGESARADYPYGWPNYLGPTAYGVSGTMYGLGLVPVPPYFALHPPVYYSVHVPRSYGYSPFAYPGCVPTPEVEMMSFPGEPVDPARPQGEELPAQETSNVAARGQWIENPFLANPQQGMIANPFLNPGEGPAPLVLTSRAGEVE